MIGFKLCVPGQNTMFMFLCPSQGITSGGTWCPSASLWSPGQGVVWFLHCMIILFFFSFLHLISSLWGDTVRSCFSWKFPLDLTFTHDSCPSLCYCGAYEMVSQLCPPCWLPVGNCHSAVIKSPSFFSINLRCIYYRYEFTAAYDLYYA